MTTTTERDDLALAAAWRDIALAALDVAHAKHVESLQLRAQLRVLRADRGAPREERAA